MHPPPRPIRRVRPHAAPVLQPLEARRLLAALTPADVPTLHATALPAKQVERLNRGVVAINRGSGNVYVGWRLLATDPANVAFNLYRSTNGAAPVKRNATPLTASTNLNDAGVDTTKSNAYFVRPVLNGVELAASESFVLPAAAPVRQYLSVPLQVPPGGTTPDNVAYTYSANDTSVGDVDGDGQYEFIVKWDPSNSKDNSQSGYTGDVLVDAYAPTAPGSGGSTSAATSAPAPTTPSSSSTTSTATAAPRSP